MTETAISGNSSLEYDGNMTTPLVLNPPVDPNKYLLDPVFSAYEER